MLASLSSNMLIWSLLYLAALVSAGGRSGYNNVNPAADTDSGHSGYNTVIPTADTDSGRSGYNDVKQTADTDAGRSGYNRKARDSAPFPVISAKFDARSRAGLAKAFYARAIPDEWAISGAGVFVLDSGDSCDQTDSVVPQYLEAETAAATRTCYDGKLYYLVHSAGEALACHQDDHRGHCLGRQFSKPPGWERLASASYGNVTLRDLVVGAVRTYENNGTNGAPAAEIVITADQDITTPGYIQIPVCGPAEAFENWKNAAFQNTRSSTFPCNQTD